MKLAPNPIAFQGRIYTLMILMMAGFLSVLVGYYRVQVLHRERYEALGEKYRIKTMPIKATRGYIYDRNGHLLTQNMPTYNLVLLRDEMEEPWRRLRPRLAEFLSLPIDKLNTRFRKGSHLLSQPVLLAENISFEETLRIKRNKRHYPGLAIETAKKRTYNHGHLFTHVLGYVGEASKRQLERNPKLKMGEIIGKTGVEFAYNELLTGQEGQRTIHIDSKGVYRSQEVTHAPVPGNDLYLTLDFDLQKLAMEAIDGRNGTVVMMEVNTGEVLVYLSSPSFDLNLFTEGMTRAKWEALNSSSASPFLNRPVQGAYAPGSVFKLVTALAALQKNKVNLSTRYFCSGEFTLNNHTSECHKKDGHGWVDLMEAIQYSCNVYFYNIARDLDVDDLAVMGRELGFGLPTGIDLAGENPGLMPNRAWKREHRNEIWYPGETLSVAIGQGALLSTPMQLVVLMSTIATGGGVPTPHLVLKSGHANELKPNQVSARQVSTVPQDHFELMRTAMWRVVNQDRGTGSNARVKGYDVCGKTGTAQIITFKKDRDEDDEDQFLNAWFAGFAPRVNAEVAIIVLVEQAGHGGHQAAPIAKRLLEAYRSRKDRMNPT